MVVFQKSKFIYNYFYSFFKAIDSSAFNASNHFLPKNALVLRRKNKF